MLYCKSKMHPMQDALAIRATTHCFAKNYYTNELIITKLTPR